MPDVYATIADADITVVEPLVDVLELRGADPQQQAMRRDYLADVDFPQNARVAEVGSGTGAVTRTLASLPDVAEAVGVDPSPVFVAKARELGRDIPNLSFVDGDARELPLEDHSFDVVVFHTTLCHVPGPERAIAEAHRVLKGGGTLAIFDGDYATTTCAIGDFDPLQSCVDAAIDALVHDRWFVRRLPVLARAASFDASKLRGHSYVDGPRAGAYMLAMIDRGADALVAAGRMGPETAAALKAEARRRSDTGTFFGHIAYASLIGRKPA
jgi:ubiquinone/menaquinone biosynthesis C-methylase UbiE